MGEKITHLKNCFDNGIKPSIAYEYVFLINKNEHKIKEQVVTGDFLHQLAGTSQDTHFIRMITHKGKQLVGPASEIDLTDCGIERFIIRPFKQEILEIENCYCEGSDPYITYKYLYRVNKQKLETLKETLSREEIIISAGADPSTHRLRIIKNGNPELIQEGEIIDLTQKGVERFILEAINCKEGFQRPVIINNLTPRDRNFLQALNFKYETWSESGLNWLVIRGCNIPSGYNVNKADIVIMIPPAYPLKEIDMIYFNPALARADGKPIGALSIQNLEGKAYQRWSRHRDRNLNPWDASIDGIESHLDLMISNLKLELKKR